jgi:adenylate cyclase
MEVETRQQLAERTNRRLTISANLSNAAGALVVVLFLVFLLPASRTPGSGYGAVVVWSAILLAIYLPAGFYLGRRWAIRRFEPVFAWLGSDEPAPEVARRIVLDHPFWSARLSAAFWGLAALLFSLFVLVAASPVIAFSVLVTVLLGGVTTSSVVYLMAERILRPAVARALADGPAPAVRLPGVTARMTMAWTLATGVPLLGIVALALTRIAGADVDEDLLVAATLFLAALALAVGSMAIVVASRAVADPIAGVRMGLQRVERGELDVDVPVDDGSEVGLLQVGFNRMAGGLRERERLREAFGAYVDPDLTRRVLEEGTDLAGEEVELSVMFLDVRGFTTLAESAEAPEVVATLNELWGIVVPIVTRHDGHANKFIGDGLLSVFGAPDRLDDHADRAVAAALEIPDAVEDRFGGRLRVGIGVNSGPVVAGTIGGGGRLDFTVIGDVVNTASRVESATRETGDDVLITADTRAMLQRDLGEWEERPPVALKGKSRPVVLYAPATRRRTARSMPRRINPLQGPIKSQ